MVRWEAVGHGQENAFSTFSLRNEQINSELQPSGSGAGSKSQVSMEGANTAILELLPVGIFYGIFRRAVSFRHLGEAS